MAMTPLAYFNEDLENPSILASHDGDNWVVPNGLRNPIDNAAGTHYHSDPDLVLHDGLLYCFYRLTNRTGATIPRYRSSPDGVHWSPLTTIDTDDGWTSLSLAYHDGQWHCFHLHSAAPRSIAHRTAPTPAGPWSAKTIATMIDFPTGRDPWHLDVTRHGGRWLIAVSDSLGGHTGSNGKILLGASIDGTAWRFRSHVLTQGPAGAWDSDMLYRPSFYIDDATQEAVMFYGGVRPKQGDEPGSSWWIGKTRIPLREWPSPA